MHASYADVDAHSYRAMLDEIGVALKSTTTLEAAAQTLTRMLCNGFAVSTALARVYVVVPHGDLPSEVKGFVETLAAGNGQPTALGPATPVLALLGTHGVKKEWCDRRTSRGHAGIPLLSGAFVESIPMIARLLKELGIDLAWLDEAPELQTRRLVGGFNGVFFVDDAATARDSAGRRIIPAQDFVAENGIKSVFGMGGFYPDGRMVVCVVFSRERLSRVAVERLYPLITVLKGATFGIVRSHRIFG